MASPPDTLQHFLVDKCANAAQFLRLLCQTATPPIEVPAWVDEVRLRAKPPEAVVDTCSRLADVLRKAQLDEVWSEARQRVDDTVARIRENTGKGHCGDKERIGFFLVDAGLLPPSHGVSFQRLVSLMHLAELIVETGFPEEVMDSAIPLHMAQKGAAYLEMFGEIANRKLI